MSMMPKPEVGQQHIKGLFSDAFGFKLPKVEKKQQFALGEPVKSVDENGNPVWNILKLNKETGETEFITIPREGEYKKGRITISESKPFIDENGKPVFIREYIKPDGTVVTKKLPYYDKSQSSKGEKKANEVNISFNQLLKAITPFTKKTSIDMMGRPVEIPRNATYKDLKKAFNGKEIYLTAKNGQKYKVIGVIENKPVVSFNGEGYKVIGERNGEPIAEIEVNGKIIAAPVSKIGKLKNKYNLSSTVKPLTLPNTQYKTADEYLSKFRSK